MCGCRKRERCECGGAGEGGGGVCGRAVEAQDSSKKVSMGVWREGEVCMGMEKCVWGECVGGVHVCERKCMYCMSVDLYMHVRIPVFWVL